MTQTLESAPAPQAAKLEYRSAGLQHGVVGFPTALATAVGLIIAGPVLLKAIEPEDLEEYRQIKGLD